MLVLCMQHEYGSQGPHDPGRATANVDQICPSLSVRREYE